MRGGAGRVGRARVRQVRDTDGGLWVVPRRSRCTGCGATHVLLPVVLLLRRADTAAVIGAGLAAKATGGGHRLIAAVLGRPPETVRGWLRRFATRVEAVRAVFTGLQSRQEGTRLPVHHQLSVEHHPPHAAAPRRHSPLGPEPHVDQLDHVANVAAGTNEFRILVRHVPDHSRNPRPSPGRSQGR